MRYILYRKYTDDIDIFQPIITPFVTQTDTIVIINENKWSFRELDRLLQTASAQDTFVISCLQSFGMNDEDILRRLMQQKSKKYCLFICNYPQTYQYGTDFASNQLVISVFVQQLTDKGIVIDNTKNRTGRPRLEFPDGWEALYEQWKDGDISSSQFLIKTGLKKASFYNMLNEYKRFLEK